MTNKPFNFNTLLEEFPIEKKKKIKPAHERERKPIAPRSLVTLAARETLDLLIKGKKVAIPEANWDYNSAFRRSVFRQRKILVNSGVGIEGVILIHSKKEIEGEKKVILEWKEKIGIEELTNRLKYEIVDE